jgi:hypothetical protein
MVSIDDEPPHGKKAFREEWMPQSRRSELWTVLPRLLSLGGTFKNGEAGTGKRLSYVRTFQAPYVSSVWPGGYVDANEYEAIIGKNVRVRSRPSTSAPVVTTLSIEHASSRLTSLSRNEYHPHRKAFVQFYA